ncbi:class I SAM-dependent methyltransferase [Candidatus Pelagibacter sp.]|jgi:ubiquinone/menaquinone biosynthesis C-methylase UbiE|nr:class I SAM-dependent methyltransferase [Candidatus Pelagibacter sp.]
MYKKKVFSKLEKKYNAYQDAGTVGFLMQMCHRQLENNIDLITFNKKNNILEIGAGSSPHINYVNHYFGHYTFLENSKYAINYLKKKFKKDKRISYKIYQGKKIPFKSNYFDRIIISHVLEHIPNPELFLNDMMRKLKKGGLLSISLPCDPGLLWRLGRMFLKIFTVKKKLKITNIEYDYMIASEHINSIFNLRSIIKHNYSKNIINESYLPFKFRLVDLNLFYNITLRK